jgi:hypothetical protein
MIVATMFLNDQGYTQIGKTYRRVLLRNSYRVSVGTHSYIIMLAYLLAYQIQRLWYYAELTVEEGIKKLVSICVVEVISPDGQLSYQTISETKELDKVLLAKIGISPPHVIPCRNVNVDTRKKLVSGRKTKKFQVVNPKK